MDGQGRYGDGGIRVVCRRANSVSVKAVDMNTVDVKTVDAKTLA